MSNKQIFIHTVLSFALLLMSSCSIRGEEICGIWNVNGEDSSMQIEITPWNGKFLGYLLAYQDGAEKFEGGKTEEYIFITDLVFEGEKYQQGSIYVDPQSQISCGLTLELLEANQVKAIYHCDGESSEEIWYREGFKVKEEMVPSSKHEKEEVEKPIEPVVQEHIPSASEIQGETKKEATFYVAGIQAVVKYDDFEMMEKAINDLWTKAYNEDFSNKLKNLINPNSMYLSYSGYDNPKGKMTITLGYGVKNLSNIPSELAGVEIPSNEYLVYPLSGEESDFEGEGWTQLGELMMQRKSTSADFEIYTFDNNYEIVKAEMWIATQ